MNTRFFLPLLLLPLLGMTKCQREPVPVFELPPATQSGANTLGFMVDGRVWRNYGLLPYTTGESDNLRSTYSPRHSRNFSLDAGQIGGDVYETFYLSLDSLTHTGTYQASRNPAPGSNPRAVRGLGFSNHSTNSDYGTFQQGGAATITITKLDTAQHIIAGTFTGTVRQLIDSTKLLHITEGRFDVQYQ